MAMWTLRWRRYEPVHSATGAPAVDGPDGDERLARKRGAELAAEDHRLEIAKRRNAREQLEQEAAERKTRSRVRRILLWMSAFIGVAGPFHLVARWIWEFFHPLSNFNLMMATVAFLVSEVCACAGIYLAARFDKGKSNPAASGPLQAAMALHTADEQIADIAVEAGASRLLAEARRSTREHPGTGAEPKDVAAAMRVSTPPNRTD
jgi:hypothetical protein